MNTTWRAQSNWWSLAPSEFDDAAKLIERPEHLALELLRAAMSTGLALQDSDDGYDIVNVDRPSGASIHVASNGVISGSAANEVRRAYRVIHGIENQLSGILQMPPEIRRSRILDFCARQEIPRAFFTRVLRAWYGDRME
jgi:hypothetical protein